MSDYEPIGNSSTQNYIHRFIEILSSLIILAIGVALIVIGALNIANCTSDNQIPTWAVLHGIICIAFALSLPFASHEHPKGTFTCLMYMFLVTGLGTWIYGMAIIFPCGKECYDGCYIHLYNLSIAIIYIPWGCLAVYVLISCYNTNFGNRGLPITVSDVQ